MIFKRFMEDLKRIISSKMSSVSWLYDKFKFAQFPKYENKFIIPKLVNLFFDAFKLWIFLCSSAVEITCKISSSDKLHPVMSKVSFELLNSFSILSAKAKLSKCLVYSHSFLVLFGEDKYFFGEVIFLGKVLLNFGLIGDFTE